ncbi:hypothetical protein C1I93_27205 [Micromonospora endophytica]|uniref:LPXTG-motif cell wall anchor domain-containing protein n=1 Tax=Micromonospora endophytica TaxID=515350 RepID=A0A2W2D324_9ACTN|nr:hypothetical protein C1I93_27205 [Micromonospora endophytica]RIW47705.1 hypothetical protein D3H59_09350 [Micromonospora endophytica]
MDPEPKFTFDLPGTTVSLGDKKKRVHLRLTNLTDETPRGLQFHVYSENGLDWMNKASLNWPAGGGSGECDGDTPGWYCFASADQFPELMPAPGGTVDLPIDIRVYEDEEPYEGTFDIEVSMDWEGNGSWVKAKKSFTLALVDDSEADLAVVAPDVTQAVRVDADGKLEPAGKLNPGETGALLYQVANQGSKAVSGIKVTLGLPKGVTFIEPPQECAIDDGGRSAVCTFDTLALVPTSQDTDPKDNVYSAVEVHHLVTVSENTEAPVTLDGGTVQVEGLTEQVDRRAATTTTKLPANAVAVPAADVDASDNQDGFAVVVAARSDGGDDDGGDGGSGGGLPVTGAPTMLIGVAGLVLVAGGGAMMLLARRRTRLPQA